MKTIRVLVLPVASMLLAGCGTLPDGRLWGQDATLVPGWAQVRESAVGAARDPWVWGPLVGAAVFQIDDWDRRVSDWARDDTPIFGSTEDARQWSDDLREASEWANYLTIVATPGGSDAGDWMIAKARGVLVQASAASATNFLTGELKATFDRERPNGADRESMPSGHTSESAVHTRLASRNLASIEMDPGTRRALDAGLVALTFGTSWARIEAGWHYPSDTLVGMALGNFIAAFVNDAFLGLRPSTARVAVAPADGGALLQWSWAF